MSIWGLRQHLKELRRVAQLELDGGNVTDERKKELEEEIEGLSLEIHHTFADERAEAMMDEPGEAWEPHHDD